MYKISARTHVPASESVALLHIFAHVRARLDSQGKGTAAVVFATADEAAQAIPLLNGSGRRSDVDHGIMVIRTNVVQECA